jgi:hypothetical protein
MSVFVTGLLANKISRHYNVNQPKGVSWKFLDRLAETYRPAADEILFDTLTAVFETISGSQYGSSRL